MHLYYTRIYQVHINYKINLMLLDRYGHIMTIYGFPMNMLKLIFQDELILIIIVKANIYSN